MDDSVIVSSHGNFLLVWSIAITVIIILLFEVRGRGLIHGFPFCVLAGVVFVKYVVPPAEIVAAGVSMVYLMSFASTQGLEPVEDEYIRKKKEFAPIDIR